jgi:Trp operon repressor
MSLAIKVLNEQLNCLLSHLMFADDPVEREELIAKIKVVREQLNKEDEIKRKISHMYLNNADNKDPSQYF